MTFDFDATEKLNFFDALDLDETEHHILQNRDLTLQNCKYYASLNLPSQVNLMNVSSKFSVLHHNVRSLVKNGQLFKDFLANIGLTFSCMLITETWLRDVSVSVEIPNYSFYCSNRDNRRGGGVGIYVNNALNYITRPELGCMTSNLEGIAIEIQRCNDKNIVIVCLYRPPDGNLSEAMQTIQSVFDKLRRENKLCSLYWWRHECKSFGLHCE